MVTRVEDPTAPPAPPPTDPGQPYGDAGLRRRTFTRYTTTPAIVAVALGALYLYVSGQ